jgi:hypothetical protein
MNSKESPEIEAEVVDNDIEKEILDELDVESLIPSMNVDNNISTFEETKECIVSDGSLLGLYEEILDDCREDRKGIEEVLSTFMDMVLNDGDASSASKEAIVNLIKIKSDTSDKMSKVADLMTRVKLKEKDTFPRYLAAQQNNKVVIEGSKRDLLKSINKITSKKGESK